MLKPVLDLKREGLVLALFRHCLPSTSEFFHHGLLARSVSLFKSCLIVLSALCSGMMAVVPIVPSFIGESVVPAI